MAAESEQHEQQKSAAEPSPVTPARLVFEQLAQGRSEIIIEHQGQEYRLRSTRRGGLILNK